MKRRLGLLLILGCIVAIGFSPAMAEPVMRGFGFGGAMAMAFFPDMTGINTFMSENGLPSMGSVLVGAGGNGRGGVIGGPVFGGGGWGLLAISEGEDTHAELISAGGGLDLGRAIGGDERSVLTVGAVLGAGANVLSVTGYPSQTVDTEGLVPEPTRREMRRIVGFVQPYVSMSAQLLPWMGFDFRIGYVLPLIGAEYGDLLGIPASSLELSGPTVSFGFMFGGIGSGARSDDDAEFSDEEAHERDEDRRNEKIVMVSDGSFVVAEGTELVIENGLGDIVISSYEADTSQTTSTRVDWQATRTAKEKRIDELITVMDVTEWSASLSTEGVGQVDYVLQIPSGMDLKVKNGAGSITLVGHEAQTIIIENGAGEVELQDVRAAVLIVAGGVGKIDLSNADAQELIAELGIGEISLELPVSVSARVIAKAGIGDVSIDHFPAMTGGVRGFISKSGNVTLGFGERMIELNVGLGQIDVRMQQP